MKSEPKGVRKGHHTVTPYIIIKDAAKAIMFYRKAFGATELMRVTSDNGKIQHAEIKIGNSPIMIVDEFPEFPIMQVHIHWEVLQCIFFYMLKMPIPFLHKQFMQVQRNWKL